MRKWKIGKWIADYFCRRNRAQDVLTEVFKHFLYESDSKQYLQGEYWTIPALEEGFRRGDCEDFVLLCRKAAECDGVGSRIATMVIDGLGGHAVVVFDGNWIGDCNRAKVYKKQDVEIVYRRKVFWKKISGYNRGDPWRSICTD